MNRAEDENDILIETKAPKERETELQQTKPAIQSQTIISAIVIIICQIGALVGWDLDIEKVTVVVSAVISIASAGYVIWRRFHTKRRVHGLFTPSNPERKEPA